MRSLKRFLKRTKEDKAESNTIAFLFVTVMLLMTTITIIDTGIYFLNRNMVSNAAMNGARLASIYGGTGGPEGTYISQQYGVQTKDCKNTSNPVSCAVEKELKNTSLIGVQLGSEKVAAGSAITCGPKETKKVGERTYCEVTWTYKGVPGSAFSFIKRSDPSNLTKMSAESEIGYE